MKVECRLKWSLVNNEIFSSLQRENFQFSSRVNIWGRWRGTKFCMTQWITFRNSLMPIVFFFHFIAPITVHSYGHPPPSFVYNIVCPRSQKLDAKIRICIRIQMKHIWLGWTWINLSPSLIYGFEIVALIAREFVASLCFFWLESFEFVVVVVLTVVVVVLLVVCFF